MTNILKWAAALVSCCCFSMSYGQKAKPNVEKFILNIDAAQKKQQLDGIGVNVNTSSWNGKELEPAIGLMLDSMKSTIWRVIVETVENWEVENDNDDPMVFNWEYYDKLYETPKFKRAWDMIAYLNSRGVTDRLMINFMGVVPQWMGGEVVKPEYEDEYIEMLVSFFYYGIVKKKLKIGYISYANEPDIRKEGPTMKADQYASVLSKFIKRMQQVGITDMRYVGPDVASMQIGLDSYLPMMMKDTTVMNNLGYAGLHSYEGYYAPADSFLKHSPYPDTKLWITEWNEWCNGCDDGKIGIYDFTYGSKSVVRLIDLLENGASACIVWEGYDSYYEHHAPSPFSYWGVLEYHKDTKTYTPRKHLYTISQISRSIDFGSTRVASSPSSDKFYVIALLDSLNRLNIVGINTDDKAVLVEGYVENAPSIKGFKMTHTDSTVNFKQDSKVSLKSKKFKVTIPPNTVFALNSY